MTVSSFDQNYVQAEIAILRDKIAEYVQIIVQTERLAVGAAGATAAFILSEMTGETYAAKVAIAVIPILLIVLGYLRCISIGTIVVDIVAYIEKAEEVLIEHADLGFQKTVAQRTEQRMSSVAKSTVFFWALSFLSALVFFLMVLLGVI